LATAFNAFFAPELWAALLPVFGQEVEYRIGGNSPGFTIRAIWKDGAEDEDQSPGRYSHLWIQNTDLPSVPERGDAVFNDGVEFDVVRVNEFIIGYTSVVLQERG
jgi:hypothetical protein